MNERPTARREHHFRSTAWRVLFVALVAALAAPLANGADEALAAERRPLSKSYPTPPAVTLTPAAARVLIEQDWQTQRGQTDLRKACAEELTRSGRIVERQAARRPAADIAALRQQLAALSARLTAASDEAVPALYFQVRDWKRALLLGDPAIDFEEVLCIDNPYVVRGEAPHEVRARNEDVAVPGGRLLVIKGLGPDAVPRQLAPRPGEPAAAFWRPDLSFDARRTLYCMKSADDQTYHLHEIGLDGTSHRQLTDGGYNDLDPIYAPDGGIVFVTTRVNQYLRCGGSTFRRGVLARADADGRNIYFISANNEIDHLPVFLPDGRLLYCRWEYVDKEVMRVQSLWTVHPDGTNLQAFWGNQSQWPDIEWDAHPIPGSDRFLFNPNSHHNVYQGGLGILDRNEGSNYPDGLYNLTPHLDWLEAKRGPQDKVFNPQFRAPSCYASFLSPRPISADLFLVSARLGTPDFRRDSNVQYSSLYLMDYDGNMELLYQGVFNVLFAQPVRPRPKPQVLPSNVAWPGPMTAPEQQAAPGTMYSADVYAGSGIPRGVAKKLRVLEVESLTYGDGNRSNGKELDVFLKAMQIEGRYTMAGETTVSLVFDDSVKRILGTVPVEADGSVYFEVPPARGVYFQLLDERGRTLQTMRSLTHVMPGERRGCLGCHETKSIGPVNPAASMLALRRPASKIETPPWGEVGISFPRMIQPILDRHCVGCHKGETPAGGLHLTHRTPAGTQISWPYALLLFGKNAKHVNEFSKTSYANPIWPHLTYTNPAWKVSTRDTVVPPMTALSYNSRLLEIATSGRHKKVKVSPLEEQMLIAWIDALTPYWSLEDVLEQPDPDEASWRKRGFSYGPRMRTAPMVHRAFQQDEFRTQADRLPRDAAGNPLPAFDVINGKRVYRLPETKNTHQEASAVR